MQMKSGHIVTSGVLMRWFFMLHIFAAFEYTVIASFLGSDPKVLWDAFDAMPAWYIAAIGSICLYSFGSEEVKAAGIALLEKVKK